MTALVADTWLKDLEDALAAHIVNTMATKNKTVKVLLGEVELPRPLGNPHIVIQTLDALIDHVGGNDIVSDTEQGQLIRQRFAIALITDDDTGAKIERSNLASLFTTYCLGACRHDLLETIDGRELIVTPSGNNLVSATGDATQYIAEYTIDIHVIVSYLNLIT